MTKDDRRSTSMPVTSDATMEAPLELDLTGAQQERIAHLFSRLEKADFYELLGTPRDADKKELKRAYNALVIEFHPDRFFRKRVGPFKPKMEAIFKRLTEGLEVLCSAERRAEYDASLRTTRRSIVDDMLEEALAEQASDEGIETFDRDEVVEVSTTPPRSKA